MFRPDAGDQLGRGVLQPLCQAGGRVDVPIGGVERAGVPVDGAEVHRRRADEARDEQVTGPGIEVRRRVHLLDQALSHHRHAVAEGHRLHLVVGDVDHRRPEPALEPGDFGAHGDAELGVEVGERLVHEEGLGLAHDGPPHGHALALPPGEVGRLAVEVLGEVEDPGSVHHALANLGRIDFGEAQRECHVLPHGHVWVEGIVLEHHGDVALARRLLVHDLAADAQLTLADVLEPGDHAKRRRLPAAGGTDEDHELAVGDVEREVVHRHRVVLVALRDALEGDLGHGLLSPF